MIALAMVIGYYWSGHNTDTGFFCGAIVALALAAYEMFSLLVYVIRNP